MIFFPSPIVSSNASETASRTSTGASQPTMPIRSRLGLHAIRQMSFLASVATGTRLATFRGVITSRRYLAAISTAIRAITSIPIRRLRRIRNRLGLRPTARLSGFPVIALDLRIRVHSGRWPSPGIGPGRSLDGTGGVRDEEAGSPGRASSIEGGGPGRTLEGSGGERIAPDRLESNEARRACPSRSLGRRGSSGLGPASAGRIISSVGTRRGSTGSPRRFSAVARAGA